jgi:hypothetical protein
MPRIAIDTPLAYTSIVTTLPITVAETPVFVRQAESVWTDAERDEFINFIARNPEAGDLIPDTGGVRKVRWTRSGKGKRGGTRVVYFYHNGTMPLYLLLIYAKAQRENLTPHDTKAVRELVSLLKRAKRR